MRSDEYLWKVCMEIYRVMYAEAEPPLNFDAALSVGLTAVAGWYDNYYLSEERQQEIFEEVCKKYKCNKHEKRAISHEIWLGSAPSCFKKDDKLDLFK